MNDTDWAERFRQIYERSVEKYPKGSFRPETLFTDEDAKFLTSIGCSRQELFDFVEDWCQSTEPPFETALAITAVRRDYFLQVQLGKPSDRTISMAALPAKSAKVDGIVWLPRIIAKARAKLRGEMPADLMYDCGGDRHFLRNMKVNPADFLREVWAAGDDDRRIIEFVKREKAKC